MKRAACLLIVAGALGLSACENGHLEINKTSENTWTIYDPNGFPDRHLDKTCATQGREVKGITAPGEAYEWLYVVCAPKEQPQTTPTPDTTTEPDSFSP